MEKSRYSNPSESVGQDADRELAWLARGLGFRKVEDVHGDEQPFGNSYVVYTSRNVRLQFAYDRGETTAWVCPASSSNDWHSLDIVCGFISGRRPEAEATLVALGEHFRAYHDRIQYFFGVDFAENKSKFGAYVRSCIEENLAKAGLGRP